MPYDFCSFAMVRLICNEMEILSFWCNFWKNENVIWMKFFNWLHRKLSFDNLQCSQWKNFHQCGDISISASTSVKVGEFRGVNSYPDRDLQWIMQANCWSMDDLALFQAQMPHRVMDIDLSFPVTSAQHHGISNHRQLGCFLNSLFRLAKKQILVLHYWPFVRGIHQSLVDSPHKGPVMWKGFLYHDVTLCQSHKVIDMDPTVPVRMLYKNSVLLSFEGYWKCKEHHKLPVIWKDLLVLILGNMNMYIRTFTEGIFAVCICLRQIPGTILTNVIWKMPCGKTYKAICQ